MTRPAQAWALPGTCRPRPLVRKFIAVARRTDSAVAATCLELGVSRSDYYAWRAWQSDESAAAPLPERLTDDQVRLLLLLADNLRAGLPHEPAATTAARRAVLADGDAQFEAAPVLRSGVWRWTRSPGREVTGRERARRLP